MVILRGKKMKAKELAEKLMENPDMDIVVDCFVCECTYDNPYPKHATYEIDDVNVRCTTIGTKLIIECS